MSSENDANPGITTGQAHELTAFLELKPGGGERMRAAKERMAEKFKELNKVATVHDLRFVIFDDDKRVMFCSSYDGEWDAYINDFATIIPEMLDEQFSEVVGWPGIHDPGIKDWIKQKQVAAVGFYSAYPDATVRDVWKALKTKTAFDALLDTAN